MAVLPIIIAPDPRLKIVSQPVTGVDDGARKLMDDMLETMRWAPGVGLAAIQIGVPKRIIVIDLAEENKPAKPRYFVNPEIIWRSGEAAVFSEGCLSVPEFFEEVERPASVKVRFIDYRGKPQEELVEGMLATCLQHEFDHLEGILFLDHLSRLKRSAILRKLQKSRRLAAAG